MKHTVTNILVFTSLFSIFSPIFAASTDYGSQKFVTTAYYSPLPNQSFYLRGSYEADVRLNGRGTHGASGKAVYQGMLAAPKTYMFGTQIYFPDFGIGTVDDRGGAIVSAGSRGYDADRIDIWMGEGEEGLKRALTWGKRTVFGQILAPGSAPEGLSNIALENFPVGKINKTVYQAPKTTPVVPTESIAPPVEPKQENSIFTVSVYRNTAPETVKQLQEIMKEIGYYQGEIDGKYSRAFEKTVSTFQLENQIISSLQEKAAGYYGVKTRSKLKEVFALYKENEQKRIAEEARLALIKAEEQKKQEEEMKKVALFIQEFGDPKVDEIGAHVRRLQQ
ncbi:MAG: peptidoglycan-binding protein, partial [Candidatus Gracilibacteria bacterium]|nr:peptidoglycan-binding protein [Candidatus Gracilibacteria bacterium]